MSKDINMSQNIIRYLLKVLNFNEYKEVPIKQKKRYWELRTKDDVYESSLMKGKLFNVYEELASKSEKAQKEIIDVVIMPKVIDLKTQEGNNDNLTANIPVSLFYLKIELNSDNTFDWKNTKIIWNSGLEYPNNINGISFYTYPIEQNDNKILDWESTKKMFEKKYKTTWDFFYQKDKRGGKYNFKNEKQNDVYKKPYKSWAMRFDDAFDTTLVRKIDIVNGELNSSYYLKYTKGKEFQEGEDTSIGVAIIPIGFDRVLKDQEEGNENIKSVSPFYIKTFLQDNNTLDLEKAEVIWASSLEYPNEVDGVSFVTTNVEAKYDKSSWEAYFVSIQKVFETKFGIEWESQFIKDRKETSHAIIEPPKGYFWITPDDNINNTTAGIIRLLTYLDENPKRIGKLMENVTSKGRNSKKSDAMLGNAHDEHLGQMKNEYPLADAQREAVHCFSKLERGDLLAVSGPPGTGKTTMLQSVVAQIIVEHANMKKPAPIILATSSNNKAITNIIDAFKICDRSEVNDVLFTRWVEYKEEPLPLAMYWPSAKRKEELKDLEAKGNVDIPFYSNNMGTENYHALKQNKKLQRLFVQNANECRYVGFRSNNVVDIKNILHKKLQENINYLNKIERSLSSKEQSIGPKNFIERLVSKFMAQQQLTESKIIYDLESKVKESYFISEKKLNKEAKSVSEREPNLTKEEAKNEARNAIISRKLKEIREKKKKVGNKEVVFTLTNSQYIDKLLDMSVRYECFWLAVHYYEACWIELLDQTKDNTNDGEGNALKNRIEEMSKVCPCFVSTFFKAPDWFCQNSSYLTDYVDLLIVDEAGQACVENGLATFSLAKKAIIVGDELQIPPVYSISDKASKKYWEEATGQDSKDVFFKTLNCGSSCIMKVAKYHSSFDGFAGEKECQGLFLDEHRRCYDEIIDYSNKLLYKGLTPCKGSGEKEKSLPRMPIMAHFAVVATEGKELVKSIRGVDADTVEISQWKENNGIKKLNFTYKNSKSRFNLKEVDAIRQWIEMNKDCLYRKYNTSGNDGSEEMSIGKIISIITPFKLQAEFLKAALGEEFKDSIGTVHTFQGAESPIVIYSTVYGADEDFTFINGKVGENLMNVAVSRAKEHFFLFCSKTMEKLSKEEIEHIEEWDDAFDLLLKMASTQLEKEYNINV